MFISNFRSEILDLSNVRVYIRRDFLANAQLHLILVDKNRKPFKGQSAFGIKPT